MKKFKMISTVTTIAIVFVTGCFMAGCQQKEFVEESEVEQIFVGKYPHLLVCFLLSMAIGITQYYYGRKAYYSKSEKHQRQYRIACRVTIIVLLAVIIVSLLNEL